MGDFYDCGCADEDGKKKTATNTGRIDVEVEKEG